MSLGGIGIPGLILILIVALLVFGPSKLPEVGKAFGSTLKEFKKATNDLVMMTPLQKIKKIRIKKINKYVGN